MHVDLGARGIELEFDIGQEQYFLRPEAQAAGYFLVRSCRSFGSHACVEEARKQVGEVAIGGVLDQQALRSFGSR